MIVHLELAQYMGFPHYHPHYHPRLKWRDEEGHLQEEDVQRTLTRAEATVLNRRDVDPTFAYREGQTTSRFERKEQAIESGVARFKERWITGFEAILVLGNAINYAPKQVLVGPEEVMTKTKVLAERAAGLGYYAYDENEEEMDELTKKYEEVVAKWKQ